MIQNKETSMISNSAFKIPNLFMSWQFFVTSIQTQQINIIIIINW